MTDGYKINEAPAPLTARLDTTATQVAPPPAASTLTPSAAKVVNRVVASTRTLRAQLDKYSESYLIVHRDDLTRVVETIEDATS